MGIELNMKIKYNKMCKSNTLKTKEMYSNNNEELNELKIKEESYLEFNDSCVESQSNYIWYLF